MRDAFIGVAACGGEQAILHATKQHSDRLRALEDGAAQSNAHLDFLEQQGTVFRESCESCEYMVCRSCVVRSGNSILIVCDAEEGAVFVSCFF